MNNIKDINNKNTKTESILLQDKNKIPFTANYQVIRSKRRTYSIELKKNGSLLLRMPLYAGNANAIRILKEKQFWIGAKLAEQKERLSTIPASHGYTEVQRAALEKRYRTAALDYIPKRVEYYADNYRFLLKNNYSRITIRDQKTRWGSCSSKGTLSFNWRLMLAPPGILDYVVVHELCHLSHMNHSREFWQCVEAVLPDYKERRKWLKEHGHELTLS